MKTALLVTLLFSCLAARAGEADYITNRYPLAKGKTLSARENKMSYLYSTEDIPKLKENLLGSISADMQSLPDSLNAMNTQMNRELDLASANTSSCNAEALHDAILKRLGGFLIAEIERWSYTNRDLKTYGPFNVINEYGTVYSDTGVSGCCADIMKINNSLVSLDKLGHFISHGYEYFEISQRKTGDIFESLHTKMGKTSIPFAAGLKGESGALEFGHRQEAGGWGILSSGVYSYADLAANYDGMKFWKQLTTGENPYFACRNGEWRRTREFNWSEYVSDAWDEGINCNRYSSGTVRESVATRIKEVQSAAGKTVLTCPVEPEKCISLRARYGDVAEKVMSPECNSARRLINEQMTTPTSAVKKRIAQ